MHAIHMFNNESQKLITKEANKYHQLILSHVGLIMLYFQS